MSNRGKSTALVATILLVAAAGCGDERRLPAPELIAKGDALCKQTQDRYVEIQVDPPANAAGAADQTGELVDASKEELDGLEDLKPPDDLEEPYENYLDAKQDALDLLEDGQQAAEHQDSRRYGQLQAKVAEGAPERLKLAREIGFKICSKPQRAAPGKIRSD